jgi:hypothetical protein
VPDRPPTPRSAQRPGIIPEEPPVRNPIRGGNRQLLSTTEGTETPARPAVATKTYPRAKTPRAPRRPRPISFLPSRSWRLGERHNPFCQQALCHHARIIWKCFSVVESWQRSFVLLASHVLRPSCAPGRSPASAPPCLFPISLLPLLPHDPARVLRPVTGAPAMPAIRHYRT